MANNCQLVKIVFASCGYVLKDLKFYICCIQNWEEFVRELGFITRPVVERQSLVFSDISVAKCKNSSSPSFVGRNVRNKVASFTACLVISKCPLKLNSVA
jgi:hypothetical protein